VIQKKKILIGTDFGAAIPVQIILMSLENVWRIGMITNGERNRRRDGLQKESGGVGEIG
jgi:hypothetical protein